MKKIVYILAFIYSSCFAQNDMISKSKALQDIDTLKVYIEEIHPNAYTYVSKEDISSKYEIIKQSIIKDSLSIFELYNKLSFLTSSYNDGHLSTHYPVRIWYEEKPKVIPFTVEIENKKLYTKNVYKTINIPDYSEIISIDGVSSSEIIDTLLKITSGEVYHFKIEMIKSNFPKMLYSIYRFKDSFSLTLKSKGVTKKVIVKGISYKEYKSIGQEEKQRASFSYKILNKENYCIIDFRDFLNIDKFKIFCDNVFSDIKKQNINNLIIDLRNNSGGNSELGDELFQYISTVPFKQHGQTEMKVSQHLKNLWEYHYLPYGIMDSSEVNIIKSIKNDTVINPEDYFSLEEEGLIQLKNNPDRFNGTVYLLISNYTFSSAADFAWCFKHYNMGKIIGEETGGLGFCYGDNVFAKLPNSKLTINVACQLFYNIGATDESNHGVIPDIPIKSEKALDEAIRITQSN